MPLKIVRNDITQMNTEAIVNTASPTLDVGEGCDIAIYTAAGFDRLCEEREKIGEKEEGDVFITPGFDLPAKYIIHAVSPLYIDGSYGEEDKLRKCYRDSLALAKENNIKSISFPLIATGSFGYPRSYGLRIAVDEINSFLLGNEMDVYIVVFDSVSTELAERIYPQIEAFIKHEDVCRIREEEYGESLSYSGHSSNVIDFEYGLDFDDIEKRIGHVSDPFGVYVQFLSERQGISLTTVESTAWVSKSVVYNIRSKSMTYKPDKRTALQICVGLELSLDDTKDLLARAGYAFSPSSGEDKIWELFIANEHFDAFDISDTLEHFGYKPFVDELK